MHYLIWIDRPAQDSTPLEAVLTAKGLADHFERCEPKRLGNGKETPTGNPGLLCAWLKPGDDRHYFRTDEQTWIPSIAKSDGVPLYHVGLFNDSLPTESELRRHYTQHGDWIRFGSEKWKMPTPATVPQSAQYNDDGSMRWVPIREFAWVSDEAHKMAEEYVESYDRQVEFIMDPKPQIDWLLRLLRINYRLTPEVAAHLNLWTGQREMMDALLSTLGLQRKGAEE